MEMKVAGGALELEFVLRIDVMDLTNDDTPRLPEADGRQA